MISLYDSSIKDIVPDNFKSSPEVQALSYAVQRMNQKLMNYARRVCIVTAIDELPEDIVDLLAVELRAQYYTSDLSIETKRKLVASTLLWYMIAGTPAAVEELIQIVFGVGNVTEWFDYEDGPGEPGTFDIETSATLTPGMIEDFTSMIMKVKNTRSHLRRISIRREVETSQYVAMGQTFHSKVMIHDTYTKEGLVDNSLGVAITTGTDVQATIEDSFDMIQTLQEDLGTYLATEGHDTKLSIGDSITKNGVVDNAIYSGQDTAIHSNITIK